MRELARPLGAVALVPLALLAAALVFDALGYAGLAIVVAAIAATIRRKLGPRTLVAAAIAIPLVVLGGGLWPRLSAPRGLEGALVEDIALATSASGRPRRPFSFSWNAGTRHLLVTHAHGDDGGAGVTLVDLSRGTPTTRYFPGPEEHAHSATELPAQDTIAVHVSSESVPRTFFYPLTSGTPPVERFETRFTELETSVLDPRIDTLFLSDPERRMLEAMPPADFVAGHFERLVEHPAPFQSVKQLVLDPGRPGVVYGRADLPGRVLRLDAASGAIEDAGVGLYVPSIAIDTRRRALYATQTYRSSIVELDTDSLRVRRRRVIGGWPYGVEPVAPRGWIAVGSYIGNRVLFLDAETLAVRASLPACAKVRSIFFDERDSVLYFGDECGLHRVRLAAPPRA